jgi:hypothetical protein
MKRLGSVCLGLSIALASLAVFAEEDYQVDRDSVAQSGVPKGEIVGPLPWKSKIFPGTHREYAVYVPAQYDPKKPACVLVIQDGLRKALGWKIPTVLDNLIHKKEMPVTIGIFISPGVVPAPNKNAQPRFNRSFEYDSLGDRYARFLTDEMLPEVGKKYNLSDDPNDRAIAGSSSGGDLRFHGRLGAAPRLSASAQHSRHVCQPARRKRIPGAGAEIRSQADSRISPGRQRRPELVRRKLVDRQSTDALGLAVLRIRREARLGRGRPQQQALDIDHAERDALAVA